MDFKTKTFLEEGARFTLMGAVVSTRTGADLNQSEIDWDSVIDLAGGKCDPESPNGVLVGEFTDHDEVVRQVYLLQIANQFYYYRD